MNKKTAQKILDIHERIESIESMMEVEKSVLRTAKAIDSLELQEKESNCIKASIKAIDKYMKMINKLSVNRDYLLHQKLMLEMELDSNFNLNIEIQIKAKLELINEIIK
tara:strand:+ start:567 stop:893 length:327 start_codon:yes stop_codon:yes gene_type:complete